MKKVLGFTLIFNLFGCSENIDNQYCSCLEISELLNEKNSELIEKQYFDSIRRAEIKELVDKKNQLCEPYKLLGGEELYNKMNDCYKK